MLVGYLDTFSVSNSVFLAAKGCTKSPICCDRVSIVYDAVSRTCRVHRPKLTPRRLLIFASGIPTAEKPQAKRIYVIAHKDGASDEEKKGWAAYQEYLRSTSILIPIPRAIYRPLPVFVKRWVLLDLPMFHFDEERDGPKALEV